MGANDKGEGPGIAIPAFLIIGLGWLVLCWPAIFAHGQTGTGGWRWDIHSTYACLPWWGVLAVASVLIWVRCRKPRLPAAPRDLGGSVRQAWEAVDESLRGGPREDLRSVAAGHEEQGRPLQDVTP